MLSWCLKCCLSVSVPQDLKRYGFLLGLMAEEDSLWWSGKLADLDLLGKAWVFTHLHRLPTRPDPRISFHNNSARRELFTKQMKRPRRKLRNLLPDQASKPATGLDSNPSLHSFKAHISPFNPMAPCPAPLLPYWGGGLLRGMVLSDVVSFCICEVALPSLLAPSPFTAQELFSPFCRQRN